MTDLIAGVRVLAVADCTHGTHEFFTARFALLRRLVEKHGVRRLAIEASCSACAAIDHYLATGCGNLRRALSSLGLLMWDIEEMAEILRWMRAHNRRVGEQERVHLHGLDFWGTQIDRRRCRAFVTTFAAAKGSRAPIRRALAQIGRAEASGMMRAHRHVTTETLAALRELLALAGRAPANGESDRVRHSVSTLLALVTALRTSDAILDVPVGVPRTALLNNLLRSRFMAGELMALADRACGGAVLVWTHVYHAMKGYPDHANGLQHNMGAAVTERLGQAYYVLAEETGEGAYLGRSLAPEQSPGALSVGRIARAPEHSLPGWLAQTSGESSFVDLRQRMPSAASNCLATPVAAHAIGWLHMDAPAQLMPLAVRKAYDGLLFFSRTTPTTPTPSARQRARAGRGY